MTKSMIGGMTILSLLSFALILHMYWWSADNRTLSTHHKQNRTSHTWPIPGPLLWFHTSNTDTDNQQSSSLRIPAEDPFIRNNATALTTTTSTNSSSTITTKNNKTRTKLLKVTCSGDKYHRQLPQMIMVGTMKGGTSAVSTLMRKHSQLVQATNLSLHTGAPEVHYFDHLRNVRYRPALNLTGKEICKMRRAYQAKWTQHQQNYYSPRLAYYEKSPAYMTYRHLASQIQAVCPWTKILILLRDPVERTHSNYKHLLNRAINKKNHTTYPTLESELMQELAEMKRLGLSQAPTIDEFTKMMQHSATGTTNLTQAFALPSPKVPLEDRFPHNGDRLLHRSLYSHQVAQFRRYFPLRKQFKVIPYEIFQQQPQAVLSEIFAWMGVNDKRYNPKVLHTNYHHAQVQHELHPMTKLWLQHFFRPYNYELVDEVMLGQDKRWRRLQALGKGVWDYGL